MQPEQKFDGESTALGDYVYRIALIEGLENSAVKL